jgi:cyclic pyranopterin phosphate synthase
MHLVDPFSRAIRYLRVSLTDRCNFRCAYCMAEDPDFAKAEVLTLEEIDRVCTAFVRLGVRKLRLTGGEPLVRRDAMSLVRSLGRHLASGALDDLTLTTNGSMLFKHARGLAEAGVRRVNVSLDTLDPHKFAAVTRRGVLSKVLEGIDAARDAGLAVKVNCVALKGYNDDEFHRMVGWCGARGLDLVFIELMPMGGPEVVAGRGAYLPLSAVRSELATRWTLEDTAYRTGGPARYLRVAETGRRVGFITPLSSCFCGDCDRVRLTCTGMLYLCLGQEDAIDLRAPLRMGDAPLLEQVIRSAVSLKPAGHGFADGHAAAHPVRRSISVTGG